jgi:hypothetical protein
MNYSSQDLPEMVAMWQCGGAHQTALLLQMHGQHGNVKARHAVWCGSQAMAACPTAQQCNCITQVRQRSHCSLYSCCMTRQQRILCKTRRQNVCGFVPACVSNIGSSMSLVRWQILVIASSYTHWHTCNMLLL